MRFHNITKDDMLNGDGMRTVLWTAGCEHLCKECQNPITWDENGGLSFTEWEECEFWENLKQDYIQGATFSGGDPLHPANRNTIGRLAKDVQKLNKDVWVYTGYVLCDDNGFYFKNEITGHTFTIDWLSEIDILIDGRFDCEIRKQDIQKHKEVHWRGSSNQRIIDIQESIRTGKIVTRED